MSNPDHHQPTNSPPGGEDDQFVGRFLRQREDARNRARWARLLAERHGVHHPAAGPPRRRFPRFAPTAVAAAVLLLLGVLLLLPRPAAPRGPQLLSEYLEQREIALTYRSAGASDADPQRAIHDHYAAGEYAAAIAAARTAAPEPLAPSARYYLGLSQFYDGRLDEAITTLRPLSERPDYHSVSWYYLGLAHLRAGRTADGLRALRRVRPDSPRHHRQARALGQARW